MMFSYCNPRLFLIFLAKNVNTNFFSFDDRTIDFYIAMFYQAQALHNTYGFALCRPLPLNSFVY